MSKPKSYVVLAVTTWAFVVCFAVWLMFGVTGIPISRELGLNGVEFGLLTSTPVLTGALFRLPLGVWTDKIRRPDRDVPAASCLCHTALALKLCDQILAAYPPRIGSRCRRSLIRRRYPLRGALFSEGATRFCHGRVRSGH